MIRRAQCKPNAELLFRLQTNISWQLSDAEKTHIRGDSEIVTATLSYSTYLK